MSGTTSGLAQSVHTHLIRHAQSLGVDPNLVLTRFATERLLYRLSRSRHAERFVLKGALLLLMWLGETIRPTRDADLLGFGDLSDETLAATFAEVCAVNVEPDGMTFDPATIRVARIRPQDVYGGKRVALLARLGSARIPVQVDVGIGDAAVPAPEWCDYPSLLDLPRPRLRAYRPETAVAEKAHAMVLLGTKNSRMRDFFDVYQLAQRTSFDGVSLASAIRATFDRRRTAIPEALPSALTPAFAQADHKRAQWNAFLRKNRLTTAPKDLETVLAVLAQFLAPVFAAAARAGDFRFVWQPSGPWAPPRREESRILNKSAQERQTLRRFKPYPAYKDSGVEWLGKIPAHWEVKRLKRIFCVLNGSTPQSGVAEYWDGDIPWVTPEDLGDLQSSEIARTRRYITEAGYQSCGTTLAPAGSLVLSTRAPIGHLAIAAVELCTNQGCRCLVFRRPSVPEFFYFQLIAARPELESWGQGSTFKELAKTKLENTAIAVPPDSEQHTIASFLKRETAKIDALVTKKERLIELLQEKRTALITRAVTKGLNPNVPMKDSGVEWLGEIPAHWEVKRLKRVAQIQGGGTPQKDNLEYWRGEIPWVSPKDMKVSVILDTEDKITTQAVRESATKLVPAGAVLIVVRSGILVRSIPVAIAGCEVTLNQDLKALIPNSDLISKYLMYLISGMQRELLTEWKKEGATVESLELELVANTPTPLPAIGEQRAIAAFLDRETAKIDALVGKIREGIERLREYRTALISAAVTGKIDVREEVSIGQVVGG